MTRPDAVVWGQGEQYDADEDARAWIGTSPRSGPPVQTRFTADLARTVADRLTLLPFATWNFGDSIAFDALVDTTEELDDERWASFVRGWGRAWATRATPFARLDCTAPGRALVRVAQRFDDQRLLDRLAELADYLRSRPRLFGAYETWAEAPLLPPYGELSLEPADREWLENPPACICIDCLHFDAPFFMRLGAALGDRGLVDDAVDQATAYLDALQSESGLVDHFRLAGTDRRFGPGWGRGQGWALFGLLDIICDHPDGPGSTDVMPFRTAVARILGAIAPLQRPDGHWPIILTVPDSGDEYSTTAFMLVACQRAADLGIIERAEVDHTMVLAARALAGAFDAEGNLREVSSAVYASTVDDHYRHVPRGFVVPWGQGPALMAALLLAKETRS